MKYRHLGKAGIQVSELSLGSWVTFHLQTDVDASVDMMAAAYDAGVNFFDNAEVYADGVAEEIMGAVLAKSGWDRSSYVVSTKIFWGGEGPNVRGLSRKHIVEGTNAALARLQLDYVDLIFCHRPDFHTPVEETVRAMNHVIDQGKALYWGTSEWPAEMIRAAYEIAERHELLVLNVFHAGDGNLHPLILYDANAPGELETAERVGAEILSLCVRAGGTVTGGAAGDGSQDKASFDVGGGGC